MILLIDNYDSFTYNLYQYVGEMNPDIKVVKNDEPLDALLSQKATHVIISPGPGRPRDAGNTIPYINAAFGKLPMLGVCLGHQALCEALGAEVVYAKTLMHGKPSVVSASGLLFKGLPQSFAAARYHSLAVKRDTVPKTLRVCAETSDGEVMAVEAAKERAFGLQFHPESILTEHGKAIIANFLSL